MLHMVAQSSMRTSEVNLVTRFSKDICLDSVSMFFFFKNTFFALDVLNVFWATIVFRIRLRIKMDPQGFYLEEYVRQSVFKVVTSKGSRKKNIFFMV